MKKTLSLFVVLGSASISYAFADTAPHIELAHNQVYANKIAEVSTGTTEEAKASWWGFNEEDATDALQNAINSRVPKLIVDNTGSDWIINKPIRLVSNQEIVFSDGVVIQAKKDSFHGKNDSLFEGTKLTNLTMQGEGNAVLRMYKKDYQDKSRYSPAEWRMGIRLTDCKNVVIRNFTVSQTGGDGLYLGASANGYNKNILVEDMIFDDNHRLGMAVISAEDLIVRRCKFINTSGTPPQAGIDFEPNFSTQRLVNCVVEDSEFIGNKEAGIAIHTVLLNESTQPLSLVFNRCKIKGNVLGLQSNITRNPAHAVKGTVKFNDCHFTANRVLLRNPTADNTQYSFRNCTFDNTVAAQEIGWGIKSPIVLSTDKIKVQGAAIGGITFDNSIAIVSDNIQPIAGNFADSVTISDQITGTLLVNRDGRTTPYNLSAFIKKEQKHWGEINALKPAIADFSELHEPEKNAIRKDNNRFYLQGKFTFLQYAEQGEKITIAAHARKVYDRVTEVELQDPNGKTLQTVVLPLDGKVIPITFTAQQTGIYRVVRKSDFSQHVDITSLHRGNGLLVEDKVVFLEPQGRLYFQVPAGIKSFNLGVSAGPIADVALLDPNGKEVERYNGINNLQIFTGTRTDISKSEIWSIDVSKSVWTVHVSMYTPLAPILSTNPETMLLVE